jgi:separase
MFETTLSLASGYLRRGSVREAEYFIREAEQLANSLNAPALICRALAMKVEAQLKLRQLEGALTTLRAATDTLNDITGPDAAGLHKLHGEYNELLSQNKDAQLRYMEALKMLEELDNMFSGLDAHKRHGLPFLHRAQLTILKAIKQLTIQSSPLKRESRAPSPRSFLRSLAAT